MIAVELVIVFEKLSERLAGFGMVADIFINADHLAVDLVGNGHILVGPESAVDFDGPLNFRSAGGLENNGNGR